MSDMHWHNWWTHLSCPTPCQCSGRPSAHKALASLILMPLHFYQTFDVDMSYHYHFMYAHLIHYKPSTDKCKTKSMKGKKVEIDGFKCFDYEEDNLMVHTHTHTHSTQQLHDLVQGDRGGKERVECGHNTHTHTDKSAKQWMHSIICSFISSFHIAVLLGPSVINVEVYKFFKLFSLQPYIGVYYFHLLCLYLANNVQNRTNRQAAIQICHCFKQWIKQTQPMDECLGPLHTH